MNIIKLKVQNFEITPLEKQYVVENQVNEFTLEFEFDDSWDYETKYVVFDNEETTYKRPIINNQVIIPSELLNGRTTIQIYGQNVENGEIVKRKPSYKYSFSILNSLSTEGQEESELPTPSQWEVYIQQIQDLCNDLQDKFDDLKEECETKCNDVIERLGKDEQDIQTNTDNIKANAEAIDKLNTDLLDYSLITETGNKISMSINPNTYVITLSLKDKNDNILSTQSVDLPLETMIVSASYSNGVLTFTLKNGQTLQVPISDLINGLVSTDTFNQAVQGLSNRITTIENDYLKSTDKTELQNQITANADDIDNIQEEQLTQNADIESLQQENERLQRIVSGLPTKNASGTNFVLNDMVNCEIKEISLKGDTSQKTTTGKNLFKPYSFSMTSSGVTFTTENGYIQANGTASADAYSLYSNDAQDKLITLEAGTYCISGATNLVLLDVIRSNGQAIITTTSSQTYAVFTLFETTNVFVRARVLNGTSVNNAKIYPLLEIGSTPTSYEKYTGGVPSPNPNYPQVIETVTGNQTIQCCGKNLLNLYDKTDSQNGISITIKDGEITLNGTCTETFNLTNLGIFKNITNNKYTCNFVYISGTCTNYASGLYLSDEPNISSNVGGGVALINENRYYEVTDTGTKNYYLYFRSNSGCVFTNYKVKVQIVLGETADYDFEQFKQVSEFPISLGNIELCKIGDYQDRIYKSNGKWYLEKNVGKVVLNGSESWSRNSENKGYTLPFTNNRNTSVYAGLCNNFTVQSNAYTWTNLYYCGWNTSNVFWVREDNELASTLGEWKQWLSSHNTIVYYILETPTTTEITDENLISQLEDILNIILNENNTIIINGNLPSDTLVIGYADISKLIASLSSQDSRSVDTRKGGNTEEPKESIEEPIETKEER